MEKCSTSAATSPFSGSRADETSASLRVDGSKWETLADSRGCSLSKENAMRMGILNP